MHAHSCTYKYEHTYRQAEKEAWTCTTGILTSLHLQRYQVYMHQIPNYQFNWQSVFNLTATNRFFIHSWIQLTLETVSALLEILFLAWTNELSLLESGPSKWKLGKLHGKLPRRLNFKTCITPLGNKLLWMACLFKEITINGKSILYRDSTYGFETIFLLTQNICCMSISLTGFHDIVYTPRGCVVCVSDLTS